MISFFVVVVVGWRYFFYAYNVKVNSYLDYHRIVSLLMSKQMVVGKAFKNSNGIISIEFFFDKTCMLPGYSFEEKKKFKMKFYRKTLLMMMMMMSVLLFFTNWWCYFVILFNFSHIELFISHTNWQPGVSCLCFLSRKKNPLLEENKICSNWTNTMN